MSSGKTLATIIADWGLDNRDSRTQVTHWPDDHVASFLEQVNSCLDESTVQNLSALQTQPKRFVLVPELRNRRSESILKRALLYSDCVVLPVDFPSTNHGFTSDGIRNQIIEHIDTLVGLLPYLSSGFACAVKGYTPSQGEAENFSLVQGLRESVSLADIFTKHSTIEIESSPINAYSNSGDCEPVEAEIIRAGFDGMFTMKGHVPNTKQGFRYEFPILPHSQSARAATYDDREARPDLQLLADNVVNRRLSQLLADWTFATHVCQAALVTRSEIGWKILQEIESQFGSERGVRTERILYDLKLPFLDKLSPEQILQQRHDCSDSLDNFRKVMDSCAVEVSKAFEAGAGEREIQLIYDSYVHGPLRELDAKVREWSQKTACVSTFGAVLAGFSATLMCGASSSLTVAAVPAFISLLFGKGLADRIIELISEKTLIKRSPVNLIWRIRETSVQG